MFPGPADMLSSENEALRTKIEKLEAIFVEVLTPLQDMLSLIQNPPQYASYKLCFIPLLRPFAHPSPMHNDN